MSLTTRMLPPAEWPKLAGTEAGSVWHAFNPDETQVVVVEEADGRIVGVWCVLRLVHVECVWIAEGHRNTGGVARRLWRGMRQAAERWGARSVVTGAISDDVRGLIMKAGGSIVPGESYVLPLHPGGSTCPQSSSHH